MNQLSLRFGGVEEGESDGEDSNDVVGDIV